MNNHSQLTMQSSLSAVSLQSRDQQGNILPQRIDMINTLTLNCCTNTKKYWWCNVSAATNLFNSQIHMYACRRILLTDEKTAKSQNQSISKITRFVVSIFFRVMMKFVISVCSNLSCFVMLNCALSLIL